MRHGSLESGIGGFDYAAEMMGWKNVFSCEINPFGRHILKYYWPEAEHYADVFEFDGLRWRGKVDIISCGFPCQPFSYAGKRKGSKDDRFIWPENMRIIREARPAFVVAENVPGLITIENGMVFEQVCADLENEGYEVTPLIIPACATDKDHRRDRVWIVAHNDKFHVHNGGFCSGEIPQQQEAKIQRCITSNFESFGERGLSIQQWHQGEEDINPNWSAKKIYDTNTTGERLAQSKQNKRRSSLSNVERRIEKENWLEAATRLCSVDDGASGRLDTRAISKIFGSRITKPRTKWRTESLRGYGSAIVWQVAYEIFKAIEQTDYLNQ